MGVFLQIYHYSTGKVKVYYAGHKKSASRIAIDLFTFFISEGQFLSFYYAMGLDIEGSDTRSFLTKSRIFKLKEKLDRRIKKYYGLDLNYDVVTKDKFYAGSVLRGNGISCLEDLAVIIDGSILLKTGDTLPIEDIRELGEFLVIKNTVLEASEGVLFISFQGDEFFINKASSSIAALHSRLGRNAWVVQKKYQSHDQIRAVSPSALNVLRVVTILNGGTPVLLGGFQAFATGKAETDSWSDGSIYVGVDFLKGCLKKHGFRSLWHPGEGLVNKHPDSGIIFEGYMIPFLKETVEMCIHGHMIFYTNFILGWDVAITNDGPVIVEINEKPGMNALQCTDTSVSSEILACAKACYKYYG